MRRIKIFLAALASALAIATGSPAQDRIDGRFLGANDATGAEIRIERDGERITGVFRDPGGRTQEFEAAWVEGGAEAVLDMDQRTVLMRVMPVPFGAEVLLVPLAGDGTLVADGARFLTFVREGLEMPEVPEGFMPPPADSSRRITGTAFLISYQFWPPSSVVHGYLALAPRHRTMIRLFAGVQLDVIWKMCLAAPEDPETARALGIALRGQGVTCEQVLDTIANAQRSGRFNAYKDDVAAENATLVQAMRCGEFHVESKAACDAAARDVSRAATSLETAATFLSRYR